MRHWFDSSIGSRARELVRAGVIAATLPAAALGCGEVSATAPEQVPAGDASTDSNTGDTGADAMPEVSAEAAVEASADAPDCVPKTCSGAGAACGELPDGCGGVLACGGCGAGEVCGGGGTNQCGTSECVPKNCSQVGAECGQVSDGCSKVLECGGCASPLTCGGGGNPKTCGCKPKNCAQLGATCGTLPDGCTGVVNCGGCLAGQTCGGAGPNQCGTGSCKPESCSLVGKSCGYISDGCDTALNCGMCAGTDTCGGGGVPNQCGCTPETCESLGAACGEVDVGCGKKVDCGGCAQPDSCGGGGIKNQCGCACDLPHAKSSCQDGVCTIKSCEAGFADCDSDVANGCEAELQSSVGNCGACGKSCSFQHAGALCLLGQCTLGNCDVNFENCNGLAEDGCEANLKADPAHCSSCSQACPAIGGPPVCVAGICDVTDCSVGFGDCDKSVAGCETDTTSSVIHCGYCGNACALPNAKAKCASSSCEVAECNPGFGDCNGLASDGCEVDTTTTVTDCGSCAHVCGTPPSALPTCAAATCGFACELDRADCDQAVSNGCEVDTASDVANCGACGKVCSPAPHSTPSCAGSKCTLNCTGKWKDCDQAYENGCEIDIEHDSNACGGCNAAPCVAPNTCGGGGIPMQCGCTKTSCSALGAVCGTPSDGCGGTLSCGSCSAGLSCVAGKCVEATTGLFFNLRQGGGDPAFHRALPLPGASQLQTVNVGGVKSNALISPNGSYLLFMSGGKVWIRKLSDGTETNLGVDAQGLFAWHPAGDRFLYGVFQVCQEGIHEAAVSFLPTPTVTKTTALVPMTSMRPALDGAYSADGNRLATGLNLSYNCCGGYQNSSLVFGSLTGPLPLVDANFTVVADESHFNVRPAFTADGSEVYWLRGGAGLFKRKTDLSAPEQFVFKDASTVVGPPATYDGTYKVAVYDDAVKEIFLVAQDGTRHALGLPANEGVDSLQWQATH